MKVYEFYDKCNRIHWKIFSRGIPLKNHPGISVETGLKWQGGGAESNKQVAASAQARQREEVSVEMDIGSAELAYELTECGRR